MPVALERKLKAEARAKGFGKERTGAYVFGTLRKTGWTPSTQAHNRKRRRSQEHAAMAAAMQ